MGSKGPAKSKEEGHVETETANVVVLDPQAEEAWTTEEDDIETDRRTDTEWDLVRMLWPLVQLAMDSAENLPTSPDVRIRAFANAAGTLACWLSDREEGLTGQGGREWDEEAITDAFAEGWDDGWDIGPKQCVTGMLPERWQQAHLPQAVVQRAITDLLDPEAIFKRIGVEAKVLDSLEALARSQGEEFTDVVARVLNESVAWRRGVVH